MPSHIPIVAIVGRPNTGKSTLFNRLAGGRRALVLDKPGMTRDRLMQRIDLEGRPIFLVDTGGFYVDRDEGTVERQMRAQAEIAVREADAIIALLDVEQPDNPDDAVIIKQLRRSGKPFVLAVNKCENPSRKNAALEFHKHGAGDIIPISAQHSHNIDDLIDALREILPPFAPVPEESRSQHIHIAIVGRPNVGKSTLVNAILGYERVIANPMPGTTRDSIDTPFERDGRPWNIIDTAGIRRRGKVERGAEMLSVFSALRSLERCDVAIMLLDGAEGILAQDQHVAGYISEAARGCLIVVNKWDLVRREERIHEVWEHEIRHRLKFLPYASWVSLSAKEARGMDQLFPLIAGIHTEFTRRIETPVLNDWLQGAIRRRPPAAFNGKVVKMKYITQTGAAPPTFTIFLNFPEAVHFSYERYLKNQFYKRFGFAGSPVVLRFRRKSKDRDEE